jgi:hypothetical protein
MQNSPSSEMASNPLQTDAKLCRMSRLEDMMSYPNCRDQIFSQNSVSLTPSAPLNRKFGLCNYYKRFVRGFSQLGAPLTNLTKHGAFIFTDESHKAFDHMKNVMGTCPLLGLPDFTLPFVLECDAFDKGIGAVLMQGGQPIVFESRKLSHPKRLYSIYDKQMLGIMHALTKFRQYLVGSKFVVKTDHNSLKYFLEQKDLSECQQKWATKVHAFDFDIEYVKGKKNIVADALSRRHTTCFLMEICKLEIPLVSGIFQEPVRLRDSGWTDLG